MRYLMNKSFKRELKSFKLDVDYLEDLLGGVLEGRAQALGSGLYKIRTAGKGKGRRGGFRNILYWKKGKLIILCLLYSKNMHDNISNKAMQALKILSKEYSELSDKEILLLINNKTLEMIDYEK